MYLLQRYFSFFFKKKNNLKALKKQKKKRVYFLKKYFVSVYIQFNTIRISITLIKKNVLECNENPAAKLKDTNRVGFEKKNNPQIKGKTRLYVKFFIIIIF